MITTDQLNALLKLYPQVTFVNNDTAYDKDGKEIDYDLSAINTKVTADAESAVAAKESAQAKLAALGLTADEIKHILGS
jgi:hypothetical protein